VDSTSNEYSVEALSENNIITSISRGKNNKILFEQFIEANAAHRRSKSEIQMMVGADFEFDSIYLSFASVSVRVNLDSIAEKKYEKKNHHISKIDTHSRKKESRIVLYVEQQS